MDFISIGLVFLLFDRSLRGENLKVIYGQCIISLSWLVKLFKFRCLGRT